MVITDISNCKRNKNRVNVYVDGTFAFALYLETAMQYGLKKDMDITGLDLRKIAEDDEKKYSMDLALKYISYQMRSRRDVLKKLRQKEISDETAEWTTGKLEEMGYINDRAFAEMYAAELKERMGGRGIAHKLFEKGIDKEVAEETLQGLGSFREAAKIQAESLYEKYRDLDAKKAREKVFRTLAVRGFETEDILQAIREYGAQQE